MATHSSIHAWRIPRTEVPGGLQSIGWQELDMTERLSVHSGGCLSPHTSQVLATAGSRERKVMSVKRGNHTPGGFSLWPCPLGTLP